MAGEQTYFCEFEATLMISDYQNSMAATRFYCRTSNKFLRT